MVLNPLSGIISTSFKQLYNDAIDALLFDDACTRPCKLIYTSSKMEECDNCILSPIGRKSSGRYKDGGKQPFSFGGLCPACRGQGFRQAEVTEILNLMIIWDDKGKLNVGGSAGFTVNTPDQITTTVSKIGTYPKLNRANEIIMDTGLSPYNNQRYTRIGDPEFCGIGDSRYVVMRWKRV